MKRITNLIWVVFALLIGLSSNSITSIASNANSPDKMEVHFIDVGQGDTTLITCGGHAMLIDAGDETKGTAIQNYLQKQQIKELDYLILTHPDADHIGGAPVIITKFKINQVFLSDYERDNTTYQKLIQALDYKRQKPVTPEMGSQYSLGTAVITILAPGKEYDNPNDSSVAFIIQNGNTRFLFTGDAGEAAETDILNQGIDISADVYKAGHHGSKYSTSEEFFKAVSPSFAVISCGKNNSYGHPHAETFNKLRAGGVKVYRTDEEGTIVAISDGTDITFNVPPSESWKAGEPTGSSGTQQIQNKENEASDLTAENTTYVLNRNTKKFHKPDCSSVETIKDANRTDTTQSRDAILESGYVPCKRCNP
ncbi:MAG: MBL fold metallo-hydrolase [Lachnospiraceae bacterium]|nr:MBL fold metallo-hydrolase [Lachnospiraceae bacterium]